MPAPYGRPPKTKNIPWHFTTVVIDTFTALPLGIHLLSTRQPTWLYSTSPIPSSPWTFPQPSLELSGAHKGAPAVLLLPGEDALAQEGHQEAQARDAHADADDGGYPQQGLLRQRGGPRLVLVAGLDDEHDDDEEGQRHAERQHLRAHP